MKRSLYGLTGVALTGILCLGLIGAPGSDNGKGKPPSDDPAPDSVEGVILFSNDRTAAVTDLSGAIADIFSVPRGDLLVGLSWSPDGDRFCFASSMGFTYNEAAWGVFVVDADGQNPQRVADGGGVLTEPAWSPDGRWIAFANLHPTVNDRDLYVVDMDCVDSGGTGCVHHFPTPGFRDFSPTWSPLGDQIATKGVDNATGRSEIIIYPFDAEVPALGQPEVLTDGTPLSHDDNSLLQPDWSKETDEWIAVDYGFADGRQLALIQRHTRAVVFLTEPCEECSIGKPSWSPCNSRLVVSHLDPNRPNSTSYTTLAFVDLVFDASGNPTIGGLELLARESFRKDSYTAPDWWRGGPCSSP